MAWGGPREVWPITGAFFGAFLFFVLGLEQWGGGGPFTTILSYMTTMLTRLFKDERMDVWSDFQEAT